MKRNNLFMHVSETFAGETSSAPFCFPCLGKKAPWVQVVLQLIRERATTTAGTTDRREAALILPSRSIFGSPM